MKTVESPESTTESTQHASYLSHKVQEKVKEISVSLCIVCTVATSPVVFR